jgi:hypothetical protein
VVGFQHRQDALRFLSVLRDRMAKFGLEIHPEKTRLIEFGRFARVSRERRGQGKSETFDFLGFTHKCGRTRKRGTFQLLRHTSKKRMRATLHAVHGALRRRMHDPIPAQGVWLRRVLRGYYQYYSVPTNGRVLDAFRTEVARLWCRTLRRRSQKHRLTWERMNRLIIRWLPKVRVLHPWPTDRFDVMTRGRSPVR